MATPTPSVAPDPLTNDPAIDAATTGFRWTLNPDRTIDWSISGGFAGEFWNAPSVVQEHVEFALDLISYYADVRFNYVGSFSNPSAAYAAGSEINVGLSTSTAGGLFSSQFVWGMGYFPTSSSNPYLGAAGDVFLNISSAANTLSSYAPGSAGWFLLIHELGHALGLKHPFDSGGTGRPTLGELGVGELAIDWFTMMAYDDDYDWTSTAFDPATPMILDVLALQYLYGANMATNAGGTLFNLEADNLYLTIWDASGHDEISAANSNRGWEIYLPDDKLSTLVPTNIGYAVPLSEANLSSPFTLRWLLGDIEDATGSQFADDIYGSVLNNYIMGLGGDDWILGWHGNDSIEGGSGDDEVYGGLGNDIILGQAGLNFLRGEEGDDVIQGGADTDDSHGNMGNDTVAGGAGDDWVVGGKDNDILYGETGHDVVWGNLGNDTCEGGDGGDQVRGGQGNDIVKGDAGNDWLSGDRGSDTITGGLGADIFHTFGEAGIDRVTDFSVAQGDRVYLLPGTQYTVAQVGADTVITVPGVEGGQMVLVGVQMSTLTAGWIFGA